MTLAEFKAWFEGFTEDMDAPPTAKQWKRIKARVAQIDGAAVTREVIWRDRYWPSIVNGPHYYASTTTTGVGTISTATGLLASNVVDLGKAEYQSMLAS